MTAVIDGQLSIFDWMEDFAPAQDAEQAAVIPEQIEEPEVGEWVYTRGAPISRVMRRSYIGKKVLMDKSTSSKECYKVGILEDVITGQYWNGKEYAPCEMSIVRDETKQRNQINHTLLHPKGDMVPVSISVGVAFCDRKNPQGDLLKDADTALYRVKEAGRCGCAVY